jgi:hypothetical protein
MITFFASNFVLETTVLSLINSIRLIFIIWLQYPVNDAPSKVINLAQKQILSLRKKHHIKTEWKSCLNNHF